MIAAGVILVAGGLSLGFSVGTVVTWWRGQRESHRQQMFAFHDGLCTGLRISGGTVIALEQAKPRARA